MNEWRLVRPKFGLADVLGVDQPLGHENGEHHRVGEKMVQGGPFTSRELSQP